MKDKILDRYLQDQIYLVAHEKKELKGTRKESRNVQKQEKTTPIVKIKKIPNRYGLFNKGSASRPVLTCPTRTKNEQFSVSFLVSFEEDVFLQGSVQPSNEPSSVKSKKMQQNEIATPFTIRTEEPASTILSQMQPKPLKCSNRPSYDNDDDDAFEEPVLYTRHPSELSLDFSYYQHQHYPRQDEQSYDPIFQSTVQAPSHYTEKYEHNEQYGHDEQHRYRNSHLQQTSQQRRIIEKKSEIQHYNPIPTQSSVPIPSTSSSTSEFYKELVTWRPRRMDI